MFPVSWSSRCRRWDCRPTARPRRSPRPRPGRCSRPGLVRPVPPSCCRRATRLRSRRCAPGWTASRWPSSWPRPGVRLWVPLSWLPGWTGIPGCCPAVRPARGGTGRWRRWSRGAMSCSMRPNAACWPACRCCAAGSTSARPSGWPRAGRCSRRRSPGCWPAWPASPWCTSMTAPRSVIRCWRPSASSPPASWPPPARKRPCTCGCWTGRSARRGQRRRPWAAPAGQRGPAACQPGRTAFAPPCRGRSAGRNPRRDGNWPPGSPGGGSPPAGTPKPASS